MATILLYRVVIIFRMLIVKDYVVFIPIPSYSHVILSCVLECPCINKRRLTRDWQEHMSATSDWLTDEFPKSLPNLLFENGCHRVS